MILSKLLSRVRLSTQLTVMLVTLQALMLFLVFRNSASLPQSNNIPMVIVIEVLTTLFATALIAYFMTNQLRKIEKYTENTEKRTITWESPNKKHVDNELVGKVTHLSQDLLEAKSALKKEHESSERETRFMKALLNGIDAVVMEAQAPDYQLTFVSREAENLLGFPISDWLKPNFWSQHVAKDDLAWLEETVAVHTEKGESFTVDFRMTHKQGHSVWVRAINSVELD